MNLNLNFESDVFKFEFKFFYFDLNSNMKSDCMGSLMFMLPESRCSAMGYDMSVERIHYWIRHPVLPFTAEPQKRVFFSSAVFVDLFLFLGLQCLNDSSFL